MNAKPTLIVIVGPTGSGKTDLSIRLAQHFGAPILSADSRQVYRGMAIGSAQPTDEQLVAAQHYFIADRAVTDRFTCADFETEALALLDTLFRTHDKVIAVGGSGLYVDALCRGLDELPDADIEIRNTLNTRLQSEGLEPLTEQLRELDPEYWEAVDRHNPARVVRGLEVCLQTGAPYSTFRSGRATERPFEIVKIGIEMERTQLYERIDRRVDEMLADGLEAEARALYPHRHLPSLQTVGYREMFGYFEGLYARDEAIRLIKRNSRRYAKRQMTWFRRDPRVHWFPPTDLSDIESILNLLKSK
jgi:tRNA dimethylallyltransferase